MVWFEKWRHVLRHDPKGAGQVIDAMRHLLRKGKEAENIRKERAYFRNNRRRPPRSWRSRTNRSPAVKCRRTFRVL